MPATSNQVAALRTYIAQGEIWTGVTKPAADAIMGFDQASATPLGGTSVGLTSGPATLEYKPEFKGIEVEQAYGEIAPRVTKETVTLKFKLPVASYDKLQLALQTAALTTTTGSGATPTVRLLSIGGETFFPTQSIALVSEVGEWTSQDSTNKLYEWICLYEALSVDGLKLDFQRGETRMVEVTMTGYADVTRNEGDQLYQFVQQKST